MAAFESLEDALEYLGAECTVLSTGEHGKLCSIQAEGPDGEPCLEVPFGFYRPLSDVEGSSALLASIALVLDPASVAVDGTSTATVTATYNDSSTAEVVASLVSGSPAVASVDGATLTGLSAGESEITASYGGKTDSAQH